MAQGGGAPPAEAVRGARGVSVAIVAVVTVVLFFAGLGVGWLVFSPPPERVAELFVGTNTPFPPFEFRDPDTDTIIGFDIDLIGEVLDRAGYDWQLNDFRDFGALLSAVGSGRMDIAVSAITMNGGVGAERNQTMDFSDWYFESDQSLLVQASDSTAYCADTDDCTSAELNDTAYRVAVQTLTSSQYWVEGNLPAVNLQTFPDVTQVLQVLSAGDVDFVVIDRPAAEGIVAGNPADYKIAGTIQTNELFSFAVANGDPLGLLPIINQQLAAIKADGTYATLIAKWF